MSHPVPSGLPGRLRTLVSQEDLDRRISELAREIDRDYAACTPEAPLVAVGVLKGSVFFMVDLLKRLNVPVEVDFLQTSSYSGTSRGEVRILQDVQLPLKGRDVLLIEDIVDTGHTLNTVLGLLKYRGARSVRLAALLDKKAAREVDVPIDYSGFPIDNLFVVGYGLDLDERYRNLPFIGVVETDETDEAGDS
jgi:hypoxanthine phosphoribosyltransferase